MPVFEEVDHSSSNDSASDEDAAVPPNSRQSRKAFAKSANSKTSTSSAQISLGSDVRRGSQASPGLKEGLPEATEATPSRSTSKGNESLQPGTDEENIFSWFAATPNTPKTRNTLGRAESQQEYKGNMKEKQSYVIDKSRIKNILAEMHSSLSSSRFRRHREYRKCPIATVKDVDATLARLVTNDRDAMSELEGRKRRHLPRIEDSSGQDSTDSSDVQSKHFASSTGSEDSSQIESRHNNLIAKKKFVRTLKLIFKFFLPLEQTSEMVAKYWGAVNFLIQVRDS